MEKLPQINDRPVGQPHPRGPLPPLDSDGLIQAHHRVREHPKSAGAAADILREGLHWPLRIHQGKQVRDECFVGGDLHRAHPAGMPGARDAGGGRGRGFKLADNAGGGAAHGAGIQAQGGQAGAQLPAQFHTRHGAGVAFDDLEDGKRVGGGTGGALIAGVAGAPEVGLVQGDDARGKGIRHAECHEVGSGEPGRGGDEVNAAGLGCKRCLDGIHARYRRNPHRPAARPTRPHAHNCG